MHNKNHNSQSSSVMASLRNHMTPHDSQGEHPFRPQRCWLKLENNQGKLRTAATDLP